MAGQFFRIPVTDEEVEAEVERVTRNAREVQLDTLRRILERSAHAEYLLRHGLDGRTDEASFKACLPLITYADIQSDVDRIADGDTSAILCSDLVSSFALSSGTSGGKIKLIPHTHNSLAQAVKANTITGLFRRKAFPRTRDGKPVVMSLWYCGKQFETKSGLKAGGFSTNIFRSPGFKMKPYVMTSPDAVVFGNDFGQQMYCHLLCGLYHSLDVEQIVAIFAYMIIEPFRLLEQVWQDVCIDIREGTVNKRITDPELRVAIQGILSPNPVLANAIQHECTKGWFGIIERLFPNLLYIQSIFSGAMLPYIAPLRYYAGPTISLVNPDYLASESYFGANLDPRGPPDRTSFTIIPDYAYFEFIPVHRGSGSSEWMEDNDEIVGLTDVKIGQEYEIVVTTVAGLYRYKQGDILRVTSFYNSTPQFSFVCRKGVLLTINEDKTDEDELQMVVEKASQGLKESGLELANFTSFANIESQPGHYVIFWELRGNDERPNEDVLDRCCRILDTSFNDVYVRGRASKTIGPLELLVVKGGTFACLMEQFMKDRGVGPSQYKTPRCIVNHASLQILRENMIVSLQSPDIP